MPTARSSSESSFRPCPEGSIQGILVDIIDLGLVTSVYAGEEKTSHKVNLVWQVEERKDDGTRFLVFQRQTLSLHPKANLRKVAETLRGRKFTEEEAAQGFEIDDLKGSVALLTIVQNQVGDRVYANVAGVAPVPKGLTKIKAEDYERRDKKDSVPF